ncbi:MAG TPA: hypothetical protein VFT99_07350, partial [Roseiflexaceae bacterium]|nr:hypothetical protein [Roseiflexaceae bacterium]
MKSVYLLAAYDRLQGLSNNGQAGRIGHTARNRGREAVLEARMVQPRSFQPGSVARSLHSHAQALHNFGAQQHLPHG